MELTYIGGPTALIEAAGTRLLTDPTFDPPGKRYHFGWGTFSKKLAGPAIPAAEIGTVDGVLLSHDHHEDNLDAAGREMLPAAGTVVTTPSGHKRLGANSLGLAPWESTTVGEVKITATPARHGPPGSRPIVGEVIGFVLEWPGQSGGAVWITGDTVYFSGVGEVVQRFDIGTLIVHLGGVRFPVSGPARYTMNAAEGVRTSQELDAKTIVPIHFEHWKHFRQGRGPVEKAFAEAGLSDRVVWPEYGRPVLISA